MRPRQGLAIVFLVLFITNLGVVALADPEVVPPNRQAATGRYLVHLKVETASDASLPPGEALARQRQAIRLAKETVRTALAGRAHRVTREYSSVPFIAVEGGSDVLAALAPMVSTVYRDHLFPPSLPESSSLIRTTQAWTQGFDGSGSVVAVLDTGVDQLHPFLADKIISEACYSANGDCPNGMDTQLGPGAAVPCAFAEGVCRHGTHVAGIAAGSGSTFSGVARGARIMAIRVFSKFTGAQCESAGQDPCALAYTSDLIAAMERVYELRNQYHVAAVNMSLGGGVYLSTAECDADNRPTKAMVDLLRSAGIATVAAAGNNAAPNGMNAPACISSAISVGSTTKADAVSSFSNSASFLSLLAPGSSILSSVPGGGFAFFSGTSMATPHVVGAWAVLKQKSPQASVAAVLDALTATGVPLSDPKNGIVKSRIDLPGAVALVSVQPFASFALSVSKTGPGLVTSVPSGVACGADCSESYTRDTVVTLSATPDTGYTFTGWTGDPDCTDGSLRITADKVCTATFVDVTPPVGSMTINRNASITPTATVSVNLTAGDGAGVTGYYVSETDISPTSGAPGWNAVTPVQSYSATFPFTLSGSGGAKTVYAWYRDAAGNVSAASDSIVLQPPSASAALPGILLQPIASGLAFPIGLTHAGDGSGRVFIILQEGKIVIYNGTQISSSAFLDVTSLVSCCGERGLLGLAFHPNYASNGLFYVNYTNTAGNTVIARYKVSANPNIADPSSALTVLTIAQPYSNHNGGQLQFGPDGYLYVGMGDGGSGGDPENRAQNLGELLGKILRIDVNTELPYVVPASNPFVATAGARPEIWALGLRNPWRFSFDRLTGDLFIGDVGQSAREEVHLQPATSGGGENYGWRKMEGSICFNPGSGCNDGTLILPIVEYTHANGDCTVIGGYRYRGTQVAGLGGTYIYGDFCTGRIWGATPNGAVWSSVPLLDLPFLLSSFGEDQSGELYLTEYSAAGSLYRINSASPLGLTLNGSSTPITAAPGAIVSVGVQNGPGNLLDWVGLYQTGAPDSGHATYRYLNGSASVSLPFTLPGAPGTYEFRFFSNNSYTRIATSPTVTVQGAGLTMTVNGSSAPITVGPGATVTVGVQNGPGNQLDWVGLYQTGAPESGYVSYRSLNGSTSASMAFILPTTPGTYEFRFFPNNSYTRIATSPTVTVPGGGGLGLTVNGSSIPITAAPGATVTVGVQNGPGNLLDWVGLYLTGAPESGYVTYRYLNGSTSASLPFTLPGPPGTYEFRFFSNNSYTKIATSPSVTVQGSGLALAVNGNSTPIIVAPGAAVTVGVQNGPGNVLDWVGLYQTGAPESGYVTYRYLNGSTSASLAFTLPATSGTYEFRFFPNNSYAKLATSPTVTVQSGGGLSAVPGPNDTTVNSGHTVTVNRSETVGGCNSSGSGNWNVASTWKNCAGTVPGPNDPWTVNSGHTVTVNRDETVGGGIVATGGVLKASADLTMNAATLTLAAGSTFLFDDNSTGAVFRLILNTSSKLVCNGTSGSRVTVKSKVGGTNGRITYGGGYGGQVDCTHTDFTRIGDATHNAFEFYPGGDDIFRLQTSVVLTSSGSIHMAYFASGSTTVVLDGVSTKSSVGSTAYDLKWYFGISTGKWQIANSVFDKTGTIGTQPGLTITNNLFLAPPIFSGNNWSSFDGNLVQSGTDANFLGDLTNNYFLLTNSDNPHGPSLSSDVNLQVTGNVFEYTGSAGNGDCLIANTAPSQPAVFTITHNILLPSDGDPMNAACGDMISVIGGGTNLTLVVEHNTFNVGPPESGVSVGETYPGHADMLTSVQNNLAFSNSGLGAIINDNGGGKIVANAITTADYNGRNRMTGSYNVPTGTIRNTAGMHDVVENPNFVDSTRNLATWSAALGGAGTVADALAELAKVNDGAGSNSAYTVAALLTYVKAGFVPTNEAFHAANDHVFPSNGWMGAMAGGQAGGVTTVNGVSTPITVDPDATVTVGVQNGPGNLLDWVGLYQTGAPDSGYATYSYLNGSASASLPFTLPGTAASYEFRFFSNNSYTRIATSPTVTVQGGGGLAVTVNGSSTPITVGSDATVTVGVQSGPGNPLDWVGLYQTGAPESGYVTYRYLNGSMSASLPFTLPGTAASYEFRFFSNNSYTRIATSPTVTTQ